MNFFTRSGAQTKKAAKYVIETVRASKSRGARVLALTGDLGAGKTTFVQGLARTLGIKGKVLSPTFILMQPFTVRAKPEKGTPVSRLWHVDCYRVESSGELLSLGFGEILKDPANLVVVEWADKVQELLPKDAVWVKFEHGKRENERIIIVNAKSKVQSAKCKMMENRRFYIRNPERSERVMDNVKPKMTFKF